MQRNLDRLSGAECLRLLSGGGATTFDVQLHRRINFAFSDDRESHFRRGACGNRYAARHVPLVGVARGMRDLEIASFTPQTTVDAGRDFNKRTHSIRAPCRGLDGARVCRRDDTPASMAMLPGRSSRQSLSVCVPPTRRGNGCCVRSRSHPFGAGARAAPPPSSRETFPRSVEGHAAELRRRRSRRQRSERSSDE